jgi:hypothetical protein
MVFLETINALFGHFLNVSMTAVPVKERVYSRPTFITPRMHSSILSFFQKKIFATNNKIKMATMEVGIHQFSL